MKLTWFGHSCWKIEEGGYSVVIDPFAPGSVPGVPAVDTTADAVYCSHDHGDHNYVQGVRIVAGGAHPFRVKTVAAWHDDQEGTLRGYNTIHVIDVDDLRLVHLGDLGHLLTEEQLSQIGSADVVMVPVGGFFTIDAATAKQTVDQLKAGVVLPMHYRGEGFGYDVIAPVEDFLALYGDRAVKRYDTNTLEITGDTPAQVAVLRF